MVRLLLKEFEQNFIPIQQNLFQNSGMFCPFLAGTFCWCTDLIHDARPADILPWKSIKEPCAFSIWKGHSHARHQWRVKHHSSNFIAWRQVYCRHCAYTLSIQYNLFWAYTITCSQCLPRCINICIQVLFCRLPRTYSITWVIKAEYIAVDPWPQSNVKACHLAQVNSIAMAEEDSVFSSRAASNKCTGDAVATRSPSHEDLDEVQLSLSVLPLCSLCEMQTAPRASVVRHKGVGGLWWQEGQLGSDFGRTRGTAEQAT